MTTLGAKLNLKRFLSKNHEHVENIHSEWMFAVEQHGYEAQVENISISANTQEDFLLIRNPVEGNKIFRLFELLSFHTAAVDVVARVWSGPTISDVGDAVVSRNIFIGSGVGSVIEIYSEPTISNRGTLIRTWPVLNGVEPFVFNRPLVLPAGRDLLISLQNTSALTAAAVSASLSYGEEEA